MRFAVGPTLGRGSAAAKIEMVLPVFMCYHGSEEAEMGQKVIKAQ
jgi:hypothetical protein